MAAGNPDTLGGLVDLLKAGAITRRDFLARGSALGISLVMLGVFVRNVQSVGAAPHPQDLASAPPAVGFEGKTRGQDGELKLLLWQAPTLMSTHVSTGTKDTIAGSLVVEPLMRYMPDGSMWPNLLAEVPSMAAGTLSEDLTSVTLKLKPDVLWSDGTPFTAADVVFTHDWIVDPNNNSTTLDTWAVIDTITAVDDLTVAITYAATNLNWHEPLAGYTNPIYPKHYIEANGGDIMLTAPIGTGPYVVESFAPNDQIIYVANPNYREANKPAFARVNMKGGGDPTSVAQSVLQTGDWDYAWNVIIEPEVVAPMEADGRGAFRVAPSTNLERIHLNFSDPRTEGPDGQLSYWEIPHPFLTDPAVRQAMALAIDRQLIVDRFYDPRGETTTSNLLNGIPTIASPNTSWAYDPERAAQVLEDAGWVMNGDVREKDGVRLEITFSTSISSLRQKTQQVVKANLEAIGITVNLDAVDSGIFFDSAAGNTQNSRHLYVDMNMFTNAPLNPTPISFMAAFYAGPDRSNIAQASNGWSAANFQRYINPAYDALYEEITVGTVTDVEQLNQMLIQLNDIVINDNAIIPLINTGSKYCMHRSLIHGDITSGEDNYGRGALDGATWNIVNWNRSEPIER